MSNFSSRNLVASAVALVASDAWPCVVLSELVDRERGISYGVVQPGNETPDGVPILRVNDIRDGQVQPQDFMRIARAIESKYQRTRLRGGEVVLTVVGAYFGQCAIVPKKYANWNVARAISVIPLRDDVDPRWIVCCLRSHAVQHMMQVWATTTAQPTLNLRDVARLPIPMPPRNIRNFVTDVFFSLDEKIELNRRMNETLEATARALFQSWFIDFDPVRSKANSKIPHGCDSATAALFSDTFQDSELGQIPKGWSVGMFADIALNLRRSIDANKIQEATPYIGLEHMPRRCIALSGWGQSDTLESNKFEFKEGEILFGKLRPYFHKVGVAPIEGVCSTDILVVAPKEQEWFGLVLGHVSSLDFVSHTDATSAGTKMPRTSWQDMARFKLPLPPKQLAKALTDEIRPLVDQIKSNIHESHTLTTFQETLLPKLLSGELSLSEASSRGGRR